MTAREKTEVEVLKEVRRAISVRMRQLRNKPLTKENRAYIRDAVEMLIWKAEKMEKL